MDWGFGDSDTWLRSAKFRDRGCGVEGCGAYAAEVSNGPSTTSVSLTKSQKPKPKQPASPEPRGTKAPEPQVSETLRPYETIVPELPQNSPNLGPHGPRGSW